MYTGKCQTCGIDIPPSRGAEPRKFCSRKCLYRNHYLLHKEKILAATAKYREEHPQTKEQKIKAMQEFYERNPNYNKEHLRKYRETHPEQKQRNSIRYQDSKKQ